MADGFIELSKEKLETPFGINELNTMLRTLFELSPQKGNWTAGFTCGTSGTITLHNDYKTGTYVKIGRMVVVMGAIGVASVSSPVGTLHITGLPFTCGSGYKFYSTITVRADGLENTAITSIQGMVEQNDTRLRLEKYEAGVASGLAGDIKGGSWITICAVYFTD